MRQKFSVLVFVATLLVVGGISFFFVKNSDYNPAMIQFASAWTLVFAVLCGFITYVEHKMDANSAGPRIWGSAGWGVLIISAAFGLFAYSLSTTHPSLI